MFDIIKKYNFWDGQPIKKGFVRVQYLKKLSKHTGNSLIKVLLGQRRSGKSYILRMMIDQLISEGVSINNVIYINKDIGALNFINNEQILQKIIDEYKQKLKPEGKIYIFLDEVQEISNWERAVNSFSQDYVDEYEVFITGSNANLLSSELATYLGGRYISINVFPFSYTEYLDFLNKKRNKETFIEYMRNGGNPESLKMNDMEVKRNYISSLKDSIILRDIVGRHEVRDVYLLENVIRYMLDNIGNLFSLTAIINYLNSNKINATRETIGSYISFLEEAFFIHQAQRFDLKGKKLLLGERKYYINDPAFKLFLSSAFDPVPGKYLENAVYLDLIRKGYSVYVGKLGTKEIDFIAEKGDDRIYIQVAYQLYDNDVIEREFGNLENIKDNYNKYVVSLDEISMGNRKGIKHYLAWEWID